MEPDEFTYMPFSLFVGKERMDHVWDPVPGEAPISPMPDYELGVPASYFEYETDNRIHYLMTNDQQFIPEDERPWGQAKNPNCSSTYWKPQADLEEQHNMEDPEWIPDTKLNVYNSDKFSNKAKHTLDQDGRL